MNLKDMSSIELMNVYGKIIDELKLRNVVRTYNSPVGDYAEWLVTQKMGYKLEINSNKGYDAIDDEGRRYQIKSRWETEDTPSKKTRQLNVIRNYESCEFDYLIMVIFDKHFCVKEAYVTPHSIIKQYSKYQKHQNGYIVYAQGAILADKQTKNITNLLQ